MEPIHIRSGFALSPSNLSRGFSLVELLVVLAIIGVISVVVITSQSSFNRSIILSNTAYDVALSLRSAESFGQGARVAGGVSNVGYGIHFPMYPTSSYSLFADANIPSAIACHGLPSSGDLSAPDAQYGNCVYNESESESEKVSDYVIGNGITISRICVRKGAIPTCQDVSSSFDIVFSQPNSEPFMSANGVYVVSPAVNSVCIVLTSPQGGYQYVFVTKSGSIRASATSCL